MIVWMAIVPHEPEEFSSDLPAPYVGETWSAPEEPPARWKRGRRVAELVGNFLLGQGATQSLNALSSLFLVHKLSLDAYAQFGLALGFQNTFSVLMDLGFASTIVPLIGDRNEDKELVGRYVRSANHLRNRSFSILAPVASILFMAVMYRHHLSVGVELLLLCSVLISLYSGGTMSYFSAPLFVFARLREYYTPQVVFGAVRLAAFVSLAALGGLNAWVAAGISALSITATSYWIRGKSRRYFVWPEKESPDTDREMWRYILPASPAIILSAFQQQISLFLVSIFGGMIYIAQVAALSRIGQLFIVLATFSNIVIEPYVARLPRSRLAVNYMMFAVLAAAGCAPLVLVAFKWPGVYVWLIGPKYDGVRDVMGWYVLSASMNLVSGVMWVMNRARKWVFWSGSILEVVLLVGVQIAFLAIVGVRTTREAVFFGFAGSFCYAIAHGYVAVIGFLRGPRLQTAEAV